MRIVINGESMAGARTGVGHYTSELVRHLLESPDAQVDCFLPDWLRFAKEAWSRQSAGPASGQAGASSRAPQALLHWRRRAKHWLRGMLRGVVTRRFRGFVRRGGYDLYHEPNFTPVACDVPTVTTIHDLSVLLHPQWHPADRVAWHEQHFRDGLTRCVHYLTVSDSARREIIECLGIPPHKITRAYNGVRAGLGPLPETTVATTLRRLNLPRRYLLHVGTLEPRKNLLMLLRAYCDLPGNLRASYPLVLVGGWGWNSTELAAFLDNTARHQGVHHVGYLPDADVPAVYNGARALMLPTFYEGFGLPSIEMMACGGAVLASTAGAVAETAGPRAHLIDPNDLTGWRDAMRYVIEDESWWESLRRGAVEHARQFTWERCAADTLTAYRLALGQPPAERQAA